MDSKPLAIPERSPEVQAQWSRVTVRYCRVKDGCLFFLACVSYHGAIRLSRWAAAAAGVHIVVWEIRSRCGRQRLDEVNFGAANTVNDKPPH